MKISSDLGNSHPVTIDQLVMPAVELYIWKQKYWKLKIFNKVQFEFIFNDMLTLAGVSCL